MKPINIEPQSNPTKRYPTCNLDWRLQFYLQDRFRMNLAELHWLIRAIVHETN
jgi:hypothetical protein